MSRPTGLARLATVAILCAPLIALAQGAASTTPSNATPSTSGPADQPRSDLEKQQTQQNGQATKYGEPGSASNTQPSKTDSTSKATRSQKTSKTSSDPTSTPTPTNTVSPTKTD